MAPTSNWGPPEAQACQRLVIQASSPMAREDIVMLVQFSSPQSPSSIPRTIPLSNAHASG